MQGRWGRRMDRCAAYSLRFCKFHRRHEILYYWPAVLAHLSVALFDKEERVSV